MVCFKAKFTGLPNTPQHLIGKRGKPWFPVYLLLIQSISHHIQYKITYPQDIPIISSHFPYKKKHRLNPGSVMDVVLASQLIPATSRMLAMIARKTKVTKTNRKRTRDLVTLRRSHHWRHAMKIPTSRVRMERHKLASMASSLGRWENTTTLLFLF